MGFKREVDVDSSTGTVSAGIHTVTCTDAELQPIKEGQNAGEDNLVLKLKVETKGESGRTLIYRVPLLPQTDWKVTRTIQAFGHTIKEGTKRMALTDKLFIGKQCRAKVAIKEYQGEDQAEVQQLLPLGDNKKGRPTKAVKSKATDDDEVAVSQTDDVQDDGDDDVADDLPF